MIKNSNRLVLQGMCEKTVQDIVERFWDIVEELSINRVLGVLKDNLVGAVLIVSTLLWIPASCLISWVSVKDKQGFDHITNGVYITAFQG